MKRLALILLGLLASAQAFGQTVPTPTGTAAMVCANNTVVPTPTNGKFFYVQCDSSGKLITSSTGGTSPTGPAGGDLGGTYPNPTVAKINGTLPGPGATALAGQLPGTSTNDNASAGNVGEYLSSSVPNSTTNLTATTAINSGATITLTAGDWDVSANVNFLTTSTTNVTQWICSISATSNTLDNSNDRIDVINTPATVFGLTSQNCIVGPTRFSVSSNTQIYAIARSNFTASTQTAGGIISARRVR